MKLRRIAFLSPLCGGLAISAGAQAVCPSASPFANANDRVVDMHRASDGSLIIGGSFTSVEGVGLMRVARWTQSGGWSAIGAGVGPGVVNAIVEPSPGSFVIAGQFATSGPTTVNNVAQWNGSSWQPMGGGFTAAQLMSPPNVDALAVLSTGEVIACGRISEAGGLPIGNIVKWNGSTWGTVSGGGVRYANSSLPEANALLALPSGDFIVAGGFDRAGSVVVNNIALWTPAGWQPLGSGLVDPFFGEVRALLLMPNGNVVAAGNFDLAGDVPASNIAIWNGASWSPLSSGTNNEVFALALLPGGDLLAIGSFTLAGGVPVTGSARWNGSSWSKYLTPSVSPAPASVGVLSDGRVVVSRNAFFPAAGNMTVISELPLLPGDADGNSLVEFADITNVLASFGNTYAPPVIGPGDADGNGAVNFADITTVLANFGSTCP